MCAAMKAAVLNKPKKGNWSDTCFLLIFVPNFSTSNTFLAILRSNPFYFRSFRWISKMCNATLCLTYSEAAVDAMLYMISGFGGGA